MTINPVARQIFDFFRLNGYTPEQACGIVGNVQAESNFNPNALGDGGLAHGLCQWHPDRLLAMSRGLNLPFGPSPMPDVDTQCRGILWELHNTEKAANAKLEAATSAAQAGYNFCRWFERPADPAQWAYRGNLATTWYKTLATQQFVPERPMAMPPAPPVTSEASTAGVNVPTTSIASTVVTTSLGSIVALLGPAIAYVSQLPGAAPWVAAALAVVAGGGMVVARVWSLISYNSQSSQNTVAQLQQWAQYAQRLEDQLNALKSATGVKTVPAGS